MADETPEPEETSATLREVLAQQSESSAKVRKALADAGTSPLRLSPFSNTSKAAETAMRLAGSTSKFSDIGKSYNQAMEGILASQQRTEALRSDTSSLPPSPQARTAQLTRELLEQNRLMVQALEAMSEHQQADSEASIKDYRVNVATLLVSILSLVIAVIAIVIAT